MKMKNKTILIISLFFAFSGLLSANPALASKEFLEVEFQNDPLFSEVSFTPGDQVVRWVKVTNNTESPKLIATEAINYPGFPDASQVPSDDLSRVLLFTVREKNGSDLYGGSTGQKTLFDFYQEGQIDLSEVPSGTVKEYEYKVRFLPEEENEWQKKTTYFDILVGFKGVQQDENGQNNSSGGGVIYGTSVGGGIPPGLLITGEASKDVGQDSVTIVWDTNYPATSWVIYAEEGEAFNLDLSQPNYGYPHSAPQPEDQNKVLEHSVTITGLNPGSTYHYRCVSHASLAVSNQYTFTTLEKDNQENGQGDEGRQDSDSQGDEGSSGEQESGPEGGEQGVAGSDKELLEGGQGTAGTSSEEVARSGSSQGITKGMFTAAAGDFFDWQQLWWILLIILALLFFLFLLGKRRKKKKDQKTQ